EKQRHEPGKSCSQRRLLRLRTMAEESRADTDMGGAHGNRGLEIPAHAHRKMVDTGVTPQHGELGEIRPGRLTVWRDAHKAHDLEPVHIAATGNEIDRFIHWNPGFLLFPADIDLDEAGKALARACHFLSQYPGEFVSINAFDDIKQRDSLARLVGLERTNQMELQVGIFVPQRRPFVLGLLHPVLAEDTLTGS